MKIIKDIKIGVDNGDKDLIGKAARRIGIREDKIKYFRILKKSLDARDKNNLTFVYTVAISDKSEKVPEKVYEKCSFKANVLVVGAGPCGLFCALDLLRYGLNVTLIERGKRVSERKNEIDFFVRNKILNEECNVQFGEGGAGAFSDGKLNTRTVGEKVREVIEDFVKFGAPEEIAYDNKPHIGSDKLPEVIKNIRNEIIALGGRVLFDTKLTDLELKSGRITSATFSDRKESFDCVVLAVGHSAKDVYDLLYRRGVFMEPKEFAVGLRIEHLREDINAAQYGEKYKNSAALGAADYRLTSSFRERGAFTFCMCPGGYVMPSQSEKNTVVANGMSNYFRDGINSNSALVAQIKKSDFKSGVFGGAEFLNTLEKKAFSLGGGDYSAPVSLVKDYLGGTVSKSFGKVLPTYPVGVKFCDLSLLFPESVNSALRFAIKDMGKRLKGFDDDYAVLTGVESRTSSPVRITRGEDFTSVNVSNLYPAGEGCGYAGGITSAAADGKKIAESIARKYK